MSNLKKIFAIAFVAVFVAAMIPFLALNTQSDLVQITQEIVIGEKNPEASARGKPTPTSPDYKISINRGKTAIPVSFVLYPTNPNGLPTEFLTTAFTLSAQAWDDATSANLLTNYNNPIIIGTNTATITLNGENAVFFADLDEEVIAMASYWYNRATKEIVECDISFNTDFPWGDATLPDNIVMDLQNIATHEMGHFFNLADIYDSSKDYLTMYGYSWKGDIEKRTLAAGDIAGIKAVFGN